MNNQKLITAMLLLLSGLALTFSGCVQDKCDQTITYTALNPVYMTYEDLRNSITNDGPRELRRPGKMYFFGQYIFISEINEGVHVIDNIDPANPKHVSFIVVPGNNDIAVKGNVLYADSYIDLVALDISDVNNAVVVDREEDVFPYWMHVGGNWADPAEGVVREYVEEEVTESFDCNELNNRNVWGGGTFFAGGGNFVSLDQAFTSNIAPTVLPTAVRGNAGGGAELATGVGGSLARFTIMQDYLYIVTDQNLVVYDINTISNPQPGVQIQVGWGIETIFPFRNDKLFIGSQTAMFIYDATNPALPSLLSEFRHARSCDPVVVEGDFAYVTLRDGNPCGGGPNRLDVVRITDLNNPTLEASHSMFNPHGLGIREGTLFLCDGDAGLKIFDASDPQLIGQRLLYNFANIHAFDVIPLNSILLMIGEDGLYQYDYSDISDVRQISVIPIAQD